MQRRWKLWAAARLLLFSEFVRLMEGKGISTYSSKVSGSLFHWPQVVSALIEAGVSFSTGILLISCILAEGLQFPVGRDHQSCSSRSVHQVFQASSPTILTCPEARFALKSPTRLQHPKWAPAFERLHVPLIFLNTVLSLAKQTTKKQNGNKGKYDTLY